MHYEIDRRTWLRGEGSGVSYLLRRRDGKMCCLGQVALQRGLTESAIIGLAVPCDTTPIQRSKFPEWIKDESSALINDAMSTNDSCGISDEDREATLKAIFISAGDSITFNH